MMTVQSNFAHQETPALLELWPHCVKHCLDYESVVKRLGSDVLGVLDCASTAIRIKEADDDSWTREWSAMAQFRMRCADAAAKRGDRSDARINWRRASIFFWAAEIYLSYADGRRHRVVDGLRICSRSYIESLAPAGAVVDIEASDGRVYEGYFVRSAQRRAPVVVCVGGLDDLKESLVPMVLPMLGAGTSSLLVEIPQFKGSQMAGYDRFRSSAFLIACMNYLETRDDVRGCDVTFHGFGAGAALVGNASQMDDRIRPVIVADNDLRRSEKSALRMCFMGSDP